MNETILLVDDEDMIRDSLGTILRKEGFEVDCAGRGEEALDVLGKKNYDLVITDLKMPGMGGMEMVERLRTIAPGQKVMVITGFGSLDTAMQAQHRGVCDYLIKPIDIRGFLNSIRSALASSKESTKTEAPQLGSKFRDRIEYFSLIADFTASLTASLDVREIMDITLDRLKKIAETDCASLTLFSSTIADLYSFKNIREKPVLSSGTGLCASLSDTTPFINGPLLLASADARSSRDAKYGVLYEVMDRDDLRHAFLVPVSVKNSVIGMVDVCTRRPEPFTDIDLTLVKTIVNQASLALAKAFTYLEMEERNKEIGLLYSLSLTLNRSLKISDSIKAICEGAVEITGADGSLLQTSLEPGSIKNFMYQKMLGFHKELKRGPHDWLIMTEARTQAFFSNDPVMDGRVNSLALYSLNIRSMAYVPLIYEWEGLGGLAVFHKTEGGAFNQRDLDLLHLYARHASEVLLNAQLFEAVKKSRESVILENNKMDIVLANMTDGVATIDTNGKSQYVNDAMAEMLGMTKEEIIGRPCAEVFAMDLCSSGCPLNAPEADRDAQKCFEASLPCKKGDVLPVYISFGPIHDSAGKIRGWVKIVRSRDAVKGIERLTDSRAGAFAYSLSGPLTDLISAVELMEGDVDATASQKRYLARMRTALDAMSSAMSTVLEAGRAQGDQTLETASVINMNDLVRSVLQEMEPAARSKGVSLRGLDTEGAIKVRAESELIKKVLKTLLNNAIRTSLDSDTVSVVAHRAGASSDSARTYEISVEVGKGTHRESIHLHAA